ALAVDRSLAVDDHLRAPPHRAGRALSAVDGERLRRGSGLRRSVHPHGRPGRADRRALHHQLPEPRLHPARRAARRARSERAAADRAALIRRRSLPYPSWRMRHAVLAGLALAAAAAALSARADDMSADDKLRLLYSHRFTFTRTGVPLVTVEIMHGEK